MGKRSKTTPDYLATDSGLHDPPDKKPHFIKRHRAAFIAFFSLVGILAIAIIGFVFVINHSLGNIAKVPSTINESARPAKTDTKALNILMLGADAGVTRNGKGTSILKDAASANWPTGKYRSDATMFVHIPANKKKAYVISIPRDSYVKVYDSTGAARDSTKINAALSLYGPNGAVSTVENLSGLRINHLAMIDWDNFTSITNAVGGVDISIAGGAKTHMNGTEALKYVRERHNLPNGDFDRVKRQQNFLRAVMTKLADKGTLANPIKLVKTVNAISGSMAVDDDWTSGAMRSLALSMRSLRPGDVTFMTIPTKGTATDPIAGSIVKIDPTKDAELWDSIKDGTIDQFVKNNPKWLLGGNNNVS